MLSGERRNGKKMFNEYIDSVWDIEKVLGMVHSDVNTLNIDINT